MYDLCCDNHPIDGLLVAFRKARKSHESEYVHFMRIFSTMQSPQQDVVVFCEGNSICNGHLIPKQQGFSVGSTAREVWWCFAPSYRGWNVVAKSLLVLKLV